jgi:phosphoglycerate dehydrogenase-like enzyme
MQNILRIHADTSFDQTATNLLQQGVAPHELIFPAVATKSVLATATYSLAGMDIAFGQPDAASVLAAKSLRWVHLTSAGYTRYDTPEFRSAAKARGLILTNSSSVYDQPCAEHVMAFLLAGARQLPRSLESRCENGSPEWNQLRNDCKLLRGQSVVILGYGAIAKLLVGMLAPFHVQLAALRRRPRGDEAVPIFTLAELPEKLAAADHVINILPDNADSRHFLDATRLARMKPGATLYNIGRGTTVDQTALATVLRSGHIAAAWLDVTDPEPLPADHPLRGLKNCLITPHVAGGHENEFQSLVRHFLANFRRFVEGTPLAGQIL